MLELKNIHFKIRKGRDEVPLLEEINLRVPTGHFMAIVGPSGCGKSTLLKLIAGINQESSGSIFWNGRNLSEEGDLEHAEIGYVPQFSIAYEALTVEENIESAIGLRAETENREAFHQLVDTVLASTGLDSLRDRSVKVLSGGQRRRLSLALELVTDPVLLLCDEVTSGLDPKSEQEIVHLMHQLSRNEHRLVVNVTHSLASLELYDSVLVLDAGRVVYHGPPRALEHYFSVEKAEDVYPQLAKRQPGEWAQSWDKHRLAYYESYPVKPVNASAVSVSAVTPGAAAQFWALFFRRWKIFFRDKGQIFLQLAILIGFPFLVIVFELDGVEQTRRLSESVPSSKEAFEAETNDMTFNLNLGGIVSGLVMFQVILLTLMGSNNSAREIAGERQIFEKEKLGGVRPAVYIGSKLAFLSLLVLMQSVWMAVFVQTVCEIPSQSFVPHLLLLLLVNGAMTAICLGISSLAKTADQASLLSIYLVGFQLPLSGAVLALPEWAGWLSRPFISAYWSWAGIMDGMDRDYFRYISEVTDTWLSPMRLSFTVLIVHVTVGLFVAYIGVKKPRWDA
ncbi:MAG: ATP-binding cassette domain-containing protein [Verrucomicrobiales bacterium]|nr:ATP-binding cassette domain-containing protein [Verrucomicrobiales bacterium]MDP4793627.1 ATP-binding cassette domain-containing protein [Verrucomicrobiales bacterium]MDP4939386.1 ATP-binding cassette domain-containing protein [Verrucomicrobiales bacterium]MDP5004637.1 ATP-binding cassette domain-containing protein [Verrucomicrobiales bacterium]